jgi:alkylhydroperoxidase family enzyme
MATSFMIPRLPFDALRPDVADMLRPRIERLGYLGEFFRCAAHQPAALTSFMAFTDDLKHALPDRITEVVALTVSTELGSAYERHQHERLSIRLGFGEAWVREVEARDPDGATFTDAERCVQALTLAVVRRHGHGTAAELGRVVAAIGHEQAIAVLMLIGRYVTHAFMVNALELAPPVASPLERT